MSMFCHVRPAGGAGGMCCCAAVNLSGMWLILQRPSEGGIDVSTIVVFSFSGSEQHHDPPPAPRFHSNDTLEFMHSLQRGNSAGPCSVCIRTCCSAQYNGNKHFLLLLVTLTKLKKFSHTSLTLFSISCQSSSSHRPSSLRPFDFLLSVPLATSCLSIHSHRM